MRDFNARGSFGRNRGGFYHDGLPDIVVEPQLPQQIAVFTNDGQGWFERSFYASGVSIYVMTSGDFNGDGKTDSVVNVSLGVI
jgi:hypothetical protein